MHGKVRLYEHITFFQTKWGIFVYDDNSIKDFILQLFTANFCLPELMFSFNVSILLVSVEIIAHIVIILLIPLLSNLFENFFVFPQKKFCALFQRICFISQKQRKSFVLYCDDKVTRLLFFFKKFILREIFK